MALSESELSRVMQPTNRPLVDKVATWSFIRAIKGETTRTILLDGVQIINVFLKESKAVGKAAWHKLFPYPVGSETKTPRNDSRAASCSGFN